MKSLHTVFVCISFLGLFLPQQGWGLSMSHIQTVTRTVRALGTTVPSPEPILQLEGPNPVEFDPVNPYITSYVVLTITNVSSVDANLVSYGLEPSKQFDFGHEGNSFSRGCCLQAE